jgi:hypothetical protein
MLCYRLYQTAGLLDDGLSDPAYDANRILSMIRDLGGSFETGHIYIDYFVPEQYAVMVVLAWPELTRMPVLDHYI